MVKTGGWSACGQDAPGNTEGWKEEKRTKQERNDDNKERNKCPAWLCETFTKKLELDNEIEQLSEVIRDMKIEEVEIEMETDPTENLCDEPESLAVKPIIAMIKSPVGDLIIQFEKRKLSLARPPAKKTLEEEFRKLQKTWNEHKPSGQNKNQI